jgi:phage terminase small subunit
MPALKNPKHELFAKYIFDGMNQGDAFEKAGYSRHDASASRLRKNANIDKRIAELQQIEAVAAGLSKSWVIANLIEIAVKQKDENPSAAAKCLELLGKTEGLELFIDRSKRQDIPQTIEDLLAIAEKLPQAERDKLKGLGQPTPVDPEPEPIEPLKLVGSKG